MLDIRACTFGLALIACDTQPTELPAPSYAEFRDEVYPLLLRDCGFVQCHGNDDRFYVLYGPGRTRLDAEMDVFEPVTEDELMFAYQSSRAVLTHDRAISSSPLLSKPLDGHAHAGLDGFGRNVWAANDPSWHAVAQWAQGTP